MKRTQIIRLVLVMAAVFVSGMLVARMKYRSSDPAYPVGFEPYDAVPADLIGWAERESIPLPTGEARAVAAGPEGLLAVAIDDRIVILQGAKTSEIRPGQTVMCLAIASNAVIVAGFRQSVGVYDIGGKRLGAVTALGAKPQVSSVAVMGNAIYIADFGQHCIWKAGFDGTVQGQYPGPTPNGFVIPSAYFDVAASVIGLWVVNPGMHELILLDENLTERAKWHKAGMALDEFMGCCNPSHIAAMPCGGMVTSEKGIPRIKLVARDGALIDVVAPPSAFPGSHGPFDLAADASGRLYVLDARRQCVRVFEHLRPCTPIPEPLSSDRNDTGGRTAD
jgi:hypothetical protein